jgi:lysyl-tRNA synthetase class II
MLEAYCAFGDYATMMETVESLIKHVAEKVLGTLVIEHPIRRRFREQLQTTIDRLKVLHQKLVQDFDQSPATGAVATEAYLIFSNSFEESVKKLETLSYLNNQTPLLEAIEQTRQIFIECSVKANDLRLSPGMAVTAKDVNDYSGEFIAYLEQVLPPLNVLREEATKVSPESLNKTIDLTTWRRAKYNDLVKEKAGADWFTVSAAERRQRAHDMGAEIGKEFEDFEVTNAVFSKFIEPTLIQPTFVTHLPKELVPLAKLSPEDPTTVEVFECCINGQEISPGYTEQNDPIAQRTTLEHQAGGEQQKLDEDFLVALEHGMPPAGGIGIGIDRLCMMLLGQESIRDVILFPQLKPK